MPNPLSRVKADAFVLVGPGALMQRPSLVHWIADIITAWPHLETELGRSLAKLLGTQARIGVAIYAGLTSTVTQMAAVTKAAEASLSGEDLEVFSLLLKRTSALGKRRSKIAHRLWGCSAQVPDALLCADPGVRLKKLVEHERFWRGGSEIQTPPELFDPDHIAVYTESDFNDLFQAIYLLVNQFQLFWRMMEAKPPERGELRSALCREPPNPKELLQLLVPSS